jgi:hypothetical protein
MSFSTWPAQVAGVDSHVFLRGRGGGSPRVDSIFPPVCINAPADQHFTVHGRGFAPDSVVMLEFEGGGGPPGENPAPEGARVDANTMTFTLTAGLYAQSPGSRRIWVQSPTVGASNSVSVPIKVWVVGEQHIEPPLFPAASVPDERVWADLRGGPYHPTAIIRRGVGQPDPQYNLESQWVATDHMRAKVPLPPTWGSTTDVSIGCAQLTTYYQVGYIVSPPDAGGLP